MQSENKELKDSVLEINMLRQQDYVKQSEIDHLSWEKIKLNEEKQALLEESEKVSKELQDMTTLSKNEIILANKKIESLHFELKSLRIELEQQKENYIKSSLQNQEKTESLNQEIMKLCAENDMIKAKNEVFLLERSKDTVNCDEINRLNKEIADLRFHKDDNIKERNLLITKTSELEKTISSLHEEIENKTDALILCDQELFKFKSESKDFSAKQSALDSLIKENEILISKLKQESESNTNEQIQLSKFVEQIHSESIATKHSYEERIRELELRSQPSNQNFDEIIQERESRIAELECVLNSAEESLGGFFTEDLSKSIKNLVAQRTQGIKKPVQKAVVALGRFRSRRAGDLSPAEQKEPDDLYISSSSQSDKLSESSWSSMPAKLPADVSLLQSELSEEKNHSEKFLSENKLLKEMIKDYERQMKINRSHGTLSADSSVNNDHLKNMISSLIRMLPQLSSEGEGMIKVIQKMLAMNNEEIIETDRERKSGKSKSKFMRIFNR